MYLAHVPDTIYNQQSAYKLLLQKMKSIQIIIQIIMRIIHYSLCAWAWVWVWHVYANNYSEFVAFWFYCECRWQQRLTTTIFIARFSLSVLSSSHLYASLCICSLYFRFLLLNVYVSVCVRTITINDILPSLCVHKLSLMFSKNIFLCWYNWSGKGVLLFFSKE